jgi:dolichol-phosphate mannosyltransferase
VVIPARNERGRIGRAIREVRAAFRGSPFDLELIVVDDGSRDGTATEARGADQAVRVVSWKESRGKGAALAGGFAVSTGELVGFLDADLEYPPELLPRMAACLEARGGRACAIGVREGDPRSSVERLSSALARWLIHAVLGLGLRDTQAGVKMFPGRFARQVLAQGCERGWLFDIDALLRAEACGLAVLEFPLVQRSVRRRRAGLLAMISCLPAFLRLASTRSGPASGGGELARILRYASVGAVNTVVDVLGFAALTLCHPPGQVAWLGGLYAGLAWAVASVVGYHLHSNVTFRTRLPLAGFYLVTVAGVLLQSAAGAAGAALGGTTGAVVGKMAGVPLGAALNYCGYRLLADRSPRIRAADPAGTP